MTDLTGLRLHSTVTAGGELHLTLDPITLEAPGSDQIVVRMEAAPINPSDLGLLLGPADMTSLAAGGTRQCPTLTAQIPEWARASVAARLDQPMPVGNEGAGTVVAAGDNARHLIGKRVGILGGGMYTQLRKLPARDCIVLPEGATAAEGAAMFINPLTALGFTKTINAKGHKAMIHFAAASNLGQMLQRICLKDGIPLVNVVRSIAQVQILREIGATHVLDSTAADFEAQLTDAIAETGATVAFDPIGGGRQAAIALAAMEAAANRASSDEAYSRYGSNSFKQVYVYGALDLSPTVLDRWVGFSWSVGGWLLTPFLSEIGGEGVALLKQRVVDELKTTFASHYTKTISLTEMLDPDIVRAYQRKATGEKYLLNPSL